MNWDWAYTLEILPSLLQGLKLTLLATMSGSALAVVLGFIFFLGQRSPYRLIRLPTYWVSEFLRRTPLLVQIYFLYYLLPDVDILLPALAAGIISLGLQAGAYMADVYRAGIQTVPKGQWEAAKALNYSVVDTWLRLILPQAIPAMIPAMVNYMILMLKDSSLLATISVSEMMAVGKNLGNDSYRYLEPITSCAVIYFALSWIAAWSGRRVELYLATRHAGQKKKQARRLAEYQVSGYSRLLPFGAFEKARSDRK
ncbi:ectoine/hydroxyectoine ABC transporter permease subunit EhuD [Pseudomonas sp. dw_358]|uniref:ectoine/hydroxyectoine ABC transporter permease subunit EhuD n=1 Tax=Pseudomonas sp. dw_358 TaxID=2720083 RepID=UPI001BD3DA04|nr:ectoine/hydroxyectoine ABC transporter permease subunit EhuD [Pseudomonas sp. dw_358]